jgi:hypothetical protein
LLRENVRFPSSPLGVTLFVYLNKEKPYIITKNPENKYGYHDEYLISEYQGFHIDDIPDDIKNIIELLILQPNLGIETIHNLWLN